MEGHGGFERPEVLPVLTETDRDSIKWKEIFDSQSFKDKKQAEKPIKMHGESLLIEKKG